MNKKHFVFINLFLIRTIYAQLYLSNHQNALPSPPLANFNDLPVANLPVSNIPTTNSLTFVNSLPEGNTRLPASGLQLFAGFPFLNGLVNDLPSNSALLQNNFLQMGADLPSVSNLPNNIVANHLPPACNLPMPNNLPNSLSMSNLPTANTLAPVNSSPNSLLLGFNMANNALLLNNALPNNGILTGASVFNNAVPNLNGIANAQNLNNLVNNAPKVTRNLPNGFIGKSVLPFVNNNPISSIVESDAFLNVKQSASPVNNEFQVGSFTPNNLLIGNGLSNNGLPSGLLLSPQITNSFPVNIPASLSVSENIPVSSIPNNGQGTLNAYNLNKIQSGNVSPLTNNIQIPVANGLQFNNIPNIDNMHNCQTNLLNGQSLLSNLPVSSFLASNLPSNNVMANNQMANNHLANNLLANNLASNNLGNNLATNNLFATNQLNDNVFANNLATNNLLANNQLSNNLLDINLSNNLPFHNLMSNNLPVNSIGSTVPLASIFNIPSIIPNINLLNLGEFGHLPILSGLPIIGVTETVTVINTAPSLYL